MIEWIVSASALILLVLAVRALAKSRLSCRARYALWLLVLVRLLVPMQMFTTSWGVAEVDVPEVVVTHRADARLQLAPMEPDPSLPLVEQQAQARENWAEYEAEVRRNRSENGTPVTLAEILRAVWLVGVGVLAAVLLVSNLRFARRLRRTRVPYDALVGGMRVYVAEGLASPCLVGVFRPAVYLTPECTQDERTLRHVLAHETTHRLHGDCVWSALRLIALCLHWYNPLVWYVVIVSKRDGELACDEATLARLGEDERVAYGETLLSMVRAKPRGRDLLSASTAMTAGKKPMRERIETIAKHPRTKAVALALALAVLLTATVFAFSKAETPEETEPAPMTEEEALDALAASVEWEHGNVSFTIPEAYERAEWGILITGRYVDPSDGATRSVHYYEGEEWQPGARYTIGISNLTELIMQAALAGQRGGLYERVIDLLPPREAEDSAPETLRPYDGPGIPVSYAPADEQELFEYLAGEYWLLSGAGGWRTELHIGADGAFTGAYSSNDEYRAFSGRFDDVTRVNNYTYSMRLRELDASAYGIEGADEVLVYLPGAPVSALPEEFLQWYCAGLSFGRSQIGKTLPTVGLYNVNEEYGWFARSLIDVGWEPLPADELAAWTDRLGSTDERWSQEDGYYVTYPSLVSCFFTSYYSTPRDINLDEFLTYCPLGMDINLPDGTMTEKEREALIATGKYHGYDVPTWRYRVSDINAALTRYAGITLDDMSTDWRNDERMLYLPEYDSFYNFTSDFGPGMFMPESGEHLGSIVRLYGDHAALQVSGTPDSFRIMSFTER